MFRITVGIVIDEIHNIIRERNSDIDGASFVVREEIVAMMCVIWRLVMSEEVNRNTLSGSWCGVNESN